MKYVMMTAKEVIDKLYNASWNKRSLNFTFDDLDVCPESDPCSWHGVKLISIFDEYDYCLAIGYWGGGSTIVYDLCGADVDYGKTIMDWCADKLQEYMDNNCDSNYGCKKICVELEEE